jgi:hypothetical protein
VPGDARRPADGLYHGVPQLTAIDPSLQHADSTTAVILIAGRLGADPGPATAVLVAGGYRGGPPADEGVVF